MLETKTEFLEMLVKHRYIPPEVSGPANYHNCFYDCACGNKHDIRTVEKIGSSPLTCFFLVCSNDFLTFVEVQGFFSVKPVSLWGCKKHLMIEFIKEFRE